MSPLPPGVGRHFPGETLEPGDIAGRSRLIGRLLEDGDRSDLAWLATRVDVEQLVAWYERHAARRLSRRSRAFWACVLDRPLARPSATAEELWPLA